MKKCISMLTYLLVGMFMVSGLSSCGGGGEPIVIPQTQTSPKAKIVGSWGWTYTEGSLTLSETYTFNANGTGVIRTNYREGTSSTMTFNEEFTYTYTTDSYGEGKLILNIEGEAYLTVYSVTLTGNTLMLEGSEGILTLKKK